MNSTRGILDWVHRCRRHLTQETVRGLLLLSERLGPERILELGRGLGWAAGWPMRQRLAGNMRRAGIDPSPAVLDRYFQIMGNWAGWSLAVYQKGFVSSGINARLHFDGSLANIERALSGGKGMILATAHLFCHEIGAAAINLRHPIVALVRESKDPSRHAIKQHWYQATGLDVVYRARRASLMSDTLAYLRVLRAGKVLAITPDLPVRDGKGSPVQMFGRQVILPSGMIALSLRSGAPIVSCWGEWLKDRQGRPTEAVLRFDEPKVFSSNGDRDAVLQSGMQAWASRCEEVIRKFPENWMFWLDKSWARVWRANAER